jgi:acyl-CoA synthetase (AMP-forming)/AMP-acid ligase II
MTGDLSSAYLALAKRWPDRPAIESASRRLTYDEMMRFAGAVAEFLAAHEVGGKSRIGIAMSRNEDAFIVMLGTWLLGATALVTDFRARAEERKRLSEALNLQFFVEDRPAPGGDAYPALKINVGELSEGLERRPLPPPPGADASPVAVIGVSSGTSGTPQPVAMSHECLFARYAIARTSPQWDAGRRLAVSAPLAFSATRKHVMSRLLDGSTVIFLPLMTGAQEFADLVNESKADAVLTVPSIVRGLLPLAPPDGLLFPHVSWLMSCGAPMLPQEKLDARNRLSSGFVQNYGSTMAGMVTLLETEDIEKHSDSVGRPLPQVLVEIVDSEGEQVPAGATGAIRVRTPGAADDLPTAGNVSERESDLHSDGWIYPGDLGFLDQEGFLTIVGRSSDLIIRGGVNVFPSEIEEVIAAHPAVTEAVVVGWADPLLGEEVAAFVVLEGSAAPQEIIAWCRSRLQPDKQPREVFVVPAIPRNANGKLVRRELVARLPKR